MVNVTWYRNGIKIRRRDHPRVDFSNSRREMVISSLAASDTGDYHCEAANSINKDDPLVSEKIYIMVLDGELATVCPVSVVGTVCRAVLAVASDVGTKECAHKAC